MSESSKPRTGDWPVGKPSRTRQRLPPPVSKPAAPAAVLGGPCVTAMYYHVSPSQDLSHRTLARALDERGFRRLVVCSAPPSAQEAANRSNIARSAGTAVAGRGWALSKRGVAPSFAWTVSDTDVDWQSIAATQCVNHFQCVGQLTTKAGLVATLRDLHWWSPADQRKFFPRSYVLPEDNCAFIVDFRRSAAAAVVRLHHTFQCLAPLANLACAPRLVFLALRVVGSCRLRGESPCHRLEAHDAGRRDGACKARPCRGASCQTYP